MAPKTSVFDKFDQYKIEKKIPSLEECGLYMCVYNVQVSRCMFRFVCVGYPSNTSTSLKLKVRSNSTYIKRRMLRMLKDKLLTKYSRRTNSENVKLKGSFYSPLTTKLNFLFVVKIHFKVNFGAKLLYLWNFWVKIMIWQFLQQ